MHSKKYFSKLQKKLDALLQRPIETLSEERTTWYCKSLWRKHTLAWLISEILKKVKLSRIYINQSNRETAIKAMDEAGIEARRIIVRASGRKNEASVRSYACHLNEPKKRPISNFEYLIIIKKFCNWHPRENHWHQTYTLPNRYYLYNKTLWNKKSEFC